MSLPSWKPHQVDRRTRDSTGSQKYQPQWQHVDHHCQSRPSLSLGNTHSQTQPNWSQWSRGSHWSTPTTFSHLSRPQSQPSSHSRCLVLGICQDVWSQGIVFLRQPSHQTHLELPQNLHFPNKNVKVFRRQACVSGRKEVCRSIFQRRDRRRERRENSLQRRIEGRTFETTQIVQRVDRKRETRWRSSVDPVESRDWKWRREWRQQ